MRKYLYSASHFIGSASALLVVVAYLANFIDHGWLALTLGAYIAGALAGVLLKKPMVEHLADGISTQEALDWLQNNVLPQLPDDAKIILQAIITKVTDLMPRLKLMEQQGIVQAENRALLKQTLARYLPDAVESYLRLPSSFAKHAKIDGNKTPQMLLCEQLSLLQIHINDLENQLLSADVNAMLANGQFLQERLQHVIDFKKK